MCTTNNERPHNGTILFSNMIASFGMKPREESWKNEDASDNEFYGYSMFIVDKSLEIYLAAR